MTISFREQSTLKHERKHKARARFSQLSLGRVAVQPSPKLRTTFYYTPGTSTSQPSKVGMVEEDSADISSSSLTEVGAETNFAGIIL